MSEGSGSSVGASTRGIRHLYLHVPFCRTHCPYCDYPVTAQHPPDAARWLSALKRELELRGGDELLGRSLETLLVGGGTPSLLGPEVMQGVRGLVGGDRLEGIAEWTAEANPEDMSPALLEGWRRAGVTRVSLGLQSLRAGALAWLGRAHRPAEGCEALKRLARADFPTWGVDLLYGLPPEVDVDPGESLHAVVALGAPHVSLYELVPEPGTPLGAAVASRQIAPVDEDLKADQYLAMGAFLETAGYEAYEMTAFALPGHISRHALAILEGRPFLGLGPGSQSALGGRRSWNLRDWAGYSTAVEGGRSPEEGSERPGVEERQTEWISSRLRLREGLPREGLSPEAVRIGERWIREGLAHPDPRHVRLTPEGWLRLDELTVELIRGQGVSVWVPEEAMEEEGQVEGR